VDLRYHINLGNVGGPRPPQETYFRMARLRLTIAADGTAKGLLAGYEDIDTLYRNTFAQGGNPFIAASAADALNYTCPGIYYNLQRFADGARDPATGKCTAISSQIKIVAVPAFIVPAAPVAAVSSGT